MDTWSAILTAMIAGATAASSDVATEAVKDAYVSFKHVLQDGYRFATCGLLETKPADKIAQAAVEDELKQHQDILENQQVLKAVETLQGALLALPADKAIGLRVDLEEVRVGHDAIITWAEQVRIKNGDIVGNLIISGQGRPAGK